MTTIFNPPFSHPKVTVVILNWNGKKHLEQFLPSVLRSIYPNLTIVVGDNASTDESVAFVKAKFPAVNIIQNPHNYGYAGGYNRAMTQLDSDYYVLLNSDVEVTPNWIAPIIDLMESDKLVAVVQPKIKSWNYKNEFEYAGAAGGFIDKYGYPFCRGRIFDAIEDDEGQYNDSREIFWASGAALFVRKTYWDELKGLDETFFAHMEEVDFCWRLKNKGYKVMYCAQSLVYHLGGGTLPHENPLKTFLNFRNNLRMLYKNLPKRNFIFIVTARLCLDFLALIKFLIEGKFKSANAVHKAHVDFVKYVCNPKYRIKNRQSVLKNKSGFYAGSIVFDYFVRRIKSFDKLNVE